MATPDVSTLTLQDVVISGKGSKTASIQCGRKEAVLTIQAPVAFEPSAYGDSEKTAARVNLVLRPCEQDVEWLSELDEWVISTVAKDATKYFGKQRSAEQIRESYTPSIRDSEKYSATFKGKINLEGSGRVKIWDDEGQPRDAPEVWKEAMIRARIKVKGLWFMGANSFGITFETTDVKVLEEPTLECPL